MYDIIIIIILKSLKMIQICQPWLLTNLSYAPKFRSSFSQCKSRIDQHILIINKNVKVVIDLE